uniref:Uncharacterized protein n=1 Tax=Cryptomonas curvata TaxID=233186 RepID=A0A7S0MH47_9CRYP
MNGMPWKFMAGAPMPVNPKAHPLPTNTITGGRPPDPLDPSDDAGIETAVRTFMDLPTPIETACEDQQSTFFHIRFLVTPNTPGNATGDWKKRRELLPQRSTVQDQTPSPGR